MSDRPRFPRDQAVAVATQLQAMISPACERIAIVGSLRRSKDTVGDIELLFIPRMTTRPDGLFDRETVSVAGEVIDRLVKDRLLDKRTNAKGQFTWGDQNKLAIHVPSGIPVDLFATTPEKWWVSLVIRTGSKETNLRLTNGAIRHGGQLNAYGSGVTWKDGSHTAATSEQHVFELCHILYLEPHQR